MIQIRHDSIRGCGWRKPGGIYLMGPPLNAGCCKLPFILDVCPCCGAGIKPTRGWTWVDAGQLFGPRQCVVDEGWSEVEGETSNCPLSNPSKLGRAGLIWIGGSFYPDQESFLREAREQGISRRIHTVPNDFKLGETWVLLAHRKGKLVPRVAEEGLFEGEELEQWQPAIFSVFKPTALEYVVKGNETDEEIERLVKRGLTPVRVEPKVARVPKPMGG